MRLLPVTILVPALLVAACSGPPPRPLPGTEHDRPDFHSPAEAMLKYDANKDGKVTRAELEAGLRAEFAAADKDHNGVLDLDEMRAVNEARVRDDSSTASPLVDFKQHGYITFDEFAAGPRSEFDELDRNGDGVLSEQELHPHGRQHPQAPPQTPPQGHPG